MSEDPILAAIAKLGDDLRAEIVKSRSETAKLIDGVQAALDAALGHVSGTAKKGVSGIYNRASDAIREELKRIEQLVRLYGR